MGMLPSTVAAEMPSRFRRHSMISKKRVNCEKTNAWESTMQKMNERRPNSEDSLAGVRKGKG